MDALRRSTWELWQYFEELSFNTLLYRGPAITHPSVGFYLSRNIQFVVLGSPFPALRSWPFFEQEHRACGETTGLATHQHISHLLDQVPQVLVIAQLTLSPPAFYLYRRLGAAVFLSEHFHWKLLLAWFSYVAACFLRLPHLPPFGCRSGSHTAFFLYLTIFLICSASQIGCFSFVTFLVTVVRFPLFRSPVSPPGVTQNNDRSGFFPSPHPPPVSRPFSRGSNSIYLFPYFKCF